MSATPKLLIGLIALMVIGFLGIHTNLLPKGFGDAQAAEAELLRQAQAAVAEMSWVQVRMDGQKAYLKGNAPSRAEANAAHDAVLRVAGTGGLVGGGITRVDTSGIRLPDDTTGLLPVAAPFTFAAHHDGDGVLHLSGFVPDDMVREELLETAVRFFPDGVVDDLQLARGLPREDWPLAITHALTALARLERGGLRASNTRLEVYGNSPFSSQQDMMADVPAEYETVLMITTPLAEEEPAEAAIAPAGAP